jgi:hypothetical protein
VGVIMLGDDFMGDPNDLYSELTRSLEYKGLHVVARADITFDQTDCTSQIHQISSAHPDLVILPATANQALTCVTLATNQGYRPPAGWEMSWLGAMRFFTDNVPSSAEPVFSWSFFDDWQVQTSGMAAYRDIVGRYHPEIDASSPWTMAGFVGAKVAVELAGRCGTLPSWSCMIQQGDALDDWDSGLGLRLTYGPGQHTPPLRLRSQVLRSKGWHDINTLNPDEPSWWQDDMPTGHGFVGH